MNAEKKFSDLKNLDKFLKQNKSIDIRTEDFLDQPGNDKYKWKGLEKVKDEVLVVLKAYQRLMRIIPNQEPKVVKALLKKGIHSSLQITEIPKTKFIKDNLKILGGDEIVAESVYLRAIAMRKIVAIQYMNAVQNLEPHTHVTNVNR